MAYRVRLECVAGIWGVKLIKVGRNHVYNANSKFTNHRNLEYGSCCNYTHGEKLF